MAPMLSGAAVVDAAMLLIAGNETCPLTIRVREDVVAFFLFWGGGGGLGFRV
jgi:translation initiation factor 2 gamma subunit (eIF-2gamma)